MRERTHRNKVILIALGFGGLNLIACPNFAARVRDYTYPPTFHYIANEELRSTMWRLAYYSREVSQLMKSPEEVAIHRGELLRDLG